MPSAESPSLVEAQRLTKVYAGRRGTQGFRAVDGIDFTISRGEAFGFLGPNGAGKSSTMRMISCVARPTAGQLTVLGMDPVRDGRLIRSRIGVVPQENSLDRVLTVRENLLVYGSYFRLPTSVIRQRTTELLEFGQLADKADAPVASLSGGMRRRLVVARALINEPQVVLLDEPTTGLDPQARHALWERLLQLKKSGVSLVLTTHYMDEAEQLCDRIAIMNRGKIVAEGSPADLIATHASREVVELHFSAADRALAATEMSSLVTGAVVDRTEELSDRILLYTADGEKALSVAQRQRWTISGATIRRATIEDVFLLLTGRGLAD
jgi:lipooligosaccharide transport system ATP-binding protein